MNKKYYLLSFFIIVDHIKIESSAPSLIDRFKSIYTTVSDSIISGTSALMNNLAISEMLSEQAIITKNTAIFWDNFQAIAMATLNNSDFQASEHIEDFKKAVELGFQLADIHELEIFETQYNILLAALNKIIQKIQSPIGDNYEPSDMDITETELLFECIKLKEATEILLLIIDEINNQKQSFKKIKDAENFTQSSYQNTLYFGDYASRISFTQNFDRDGYNFMTTILGDGNCGYRAFLSSICANAITLQDTQAITQLQNLIHEKFTNIMTEFTNQYSNVKFSIKNFVSPVRYISLSPEEIENIKIHLLDQLEQIKNFKTMNEFKTLLNKQLGFDFYMIMFFRGLIAQVLRNNPLQLSIAAASRSYNQLDYLNDLLRWSTWIDDPEMQALNQITKINIYVINNSKNFDRLTEYNQIEPSYGRADIIYVNNNHYNILHHINV